MTVQIVGVMVVLDSTDCGGYGGTRQYRLWGLWWYLTVQIVGVMVVLDSTDCGGYSGT